MKICFRCRGRFSSPLWCCPHCGSDPPTIDGFLAFAPELAHASAGFDERMFMALAQTEERNFWFSARNALINRALTRYAPNATTFLDAGCGTGIVLKAVHEASPDLRLTGADPLVAGLAWARTRVPGAELIQSELRSLPFEGAFDVCGVFDVLEHVEHDEEAIGTIHRVLSPDGTLVVTVPQHRWLWSAVDDVAHHRRRYTRHELTEKLRRKGFTTVFATAFVSLLLPVMFAARRLRTSVSGPELEVPAAVNTILRVAMALERALIAGGLRFSAGGSLLVVAKRDG